MSKKSRFKRLLRRQKELERGTEEKPEKEEKPKEVHHEVKHKNPLLNVYDKHYKKLLIIPFALLFLAFIIIGVKYVQTGEFFNKSVDIKGGISITIPTEDDISDLQTYLLSNFNNNDVSVRTLSVAGRQTGVTIDIDIDLNDNENIRKLIELLRAKLNLSLEQGEYTITGIGSSLGKSFFRETIVAVLIAFLFMAIVVFLYFRVFVVSGAVILAAFSDIIITLAIINLIGMRLSTAGIAAFLMLIGYSVDTDILLSTRVLKGKEGTILDRIISAMKTGLTMSITTIVAISIALIFTQSDILKQIMIVVLIGLLVDIINTWIQNAGILRWYLEKKHVR